MADWNDALEDHEREITGEEPTAGDRIVANTYRMLDEFADFYASLPEPSAIDRIALALVATRAALAAAQCGDARLARLYLPDAITHLERAAAKLNAECAR